MIFKNCHPTDYDKKLDELERKHKQEIADLNLSRYYMFTIRDRFKDTRILEADGEIRIVPNIPLAVISVPDLKTVRWVRFALPADEQMATVFNGNRDIETYSPYKFTIVNSVVHNVPHPVINWKWMGLRVQVELPDMYQHSADVVSIRSRIPMQSEQSFLRSQGWASKRSKEPVDQYYLDMFGLQKFYGGNAVTYAHQQDAREPFEFVIFNGHVREHAEHWANHLEKLKQEMQKL